MTHNRYQKMEVYQMIEVKGMTIMELTAYANSLTNEEFEKFENEVDLEDFDIDLDPISLLKGSRLYDYMNYKRNGDITVEL